ncbi:hypothetical protein LCGC14_0613960 [marine sediment metagenome]|uniref:Uncharacterized protein n=1 Tax=marine sediment metagenome TaxID=412755 RepID=A0A0F9TT78_9ZZZZ
MADKKYASFSPEDMTQGGLIDDVDVEITGAAFEMYDYNGSQPIPVPVLKVSYRVLEDNATFDDYQSCGDKNTWVPDDEGERLTDISPGQNATIKTSSNCGIFMTSLANAGFPMDKLDGPISVLAGMEAHVVRQPAPVRKGLDEAKTNDDGTKKFPKTILVIEEIKVLPWDAEEGETPKKAAGKKGKKAPAKKAAGKKASTKKAASGEAEAEATIYILGLLEKAGDDGVTKKDLPRHIFTDLQDDPNRNAIIQITNGDEYLSAGPWNLEGGVLTALSTDE